LVGSDLLQRRRQDARACVVQLTHAGRRALNSTQRNVRQADTALLARLSGEQRKALVEELKVISTV
jgi:DNA-binding MarR family transcriptional regulator